MASPPSPAPAGDRRRLGLLLTALLALALVAVLSGPAARLFSPSTATSAPREPALPVITVSTDGPAQPINPLVYGLGAGVSTSTYQPPFPGLEGRLASDLRASGATALRFGADHADDFSWEESRLYLPGSEPELVGTGTGRYAGIDAFLNFTHRYHLVPIIAVNAEVDDPQQAARLVAYTQARGTPVTYWEIGNEPYQWTDFAVALRQRQPSDRYKASPDDYAAIVVAYAQAMRSAAHCAGAPRRHCLKIIADEWITNATDQSWTAAVDLIDTHYYAFFGFGARPPSDRDVAAGSFAATLPQQRLSATSWLDDLHAAMNSFSGAENLGVMAGSWGLDPVPATDSHYADFAQALFVAQMLGQMIEGGVQMANAFPFYGAAEDQALIDDTARPRAGLWAFALYTDRFGRWVLPVHLSRGARAAALWATAGSTTGRDRTVLVVNDTPGTSVAAHIVLAGARQPVRGWNPRAQVWTLRHDRPDGPPFYGTSGIQASSLLLSLAGNAFTATFPPSSITLLRLQPR